MTEPQLHMLTLHVRLRESDAAQELARSVSTGFRQEVWDALAELNVLDARITAIPAADDAERFESILLCTTFALNNEEYQEKFFWRFPAVFVSLAQAAVDSPFDAAPLTERQRMALTEPTPTRREDLLPVLETLRAWINAHDLTLGAPLHRPDEGERTQFHVPARAA